MGLIFSDEVRGNLLERVEFVALDGERKVLCSIERQTLKGWTRFRTINLVSLYKDNVDVIRNAAAARYLMEPSDTVVVRLEDLPKRAVG